MKHRAIFQYGILAIFVFLALSSLGYLILMPRLNPRVQPQANMMASCSSRNPCLAIIIDDIGREVTSLQPLLALDVPLTFAVLPHADQTRKSIELIRKARREVLLHLPMQPEVSSKITDEPIIFSGETGAADEQQRVLDNCLANVPFAMGFNNHMGSALTQDPAALKPLLAWAHSRGLMALDSRTSANSVLCRVAQHHQVPCLQRDVFLDNDSDPSAIRKQFEEGIAVARKRGTAILIGHPRENTIQILANQLRDSPIPIVPLSTLYRAHFQK